MKNTIITVVSTKKNLFGIVREWANKHRKENSIEFSIVGNSLTVDILAPKEQTNRAISALTKLIG